MWYNMQDKSKSALHSGGTRRGRASRVVHQPRRETAIGPCLADGSSDRSGDGTSEITGSRYTHRAD